MNWSKEQINKMTSDEYKQALETHGDDFRRAVDAADSQPASRRANGNVRDAAESAPTKTFADSPEWADEPSAAAPAPAPATAEPAPAEPVQPVATAKDFSDLPERIHEYQPTITNKKDGKSTPVGGIQRFKYRTVDDPNDPNSLVLQLQKAHAHSSAKVRELSRDLKLSKIVASTKSPAALSTDVPQTKDELAKELVETRHEAFLARVQMALAEFKSSKVWQPYQSTENAETLVLAVQKSGDDPRDPASFHKAFENMREFLIPVTAEQVPASTTPTPAPIEQVAAATASAPTQRVGVASGISSVDSFNTAEESPFESVNNVQVGIVVNGTRITSIAQWDKVPSDLQKRVLRLPSNARIVDNLYAKQAEERLARRSSR